jgi:nucleotide-binding universal stress UspA family protein
MEFKHILVGIDLFKPCQAALDYAAYQKKIHQAELTIVNVLEKYQLPPELQRVIWNPERVAKMEQEYNEAAREALNQLVEKHMHGVEVNKEILISDKAAGEVIAEQARKSDCDLIVLAGKGKTALGHFFLGSTVQKTLVYATCPVLVIPGKDEEAE